MASNSGFVAEETLTFESSEFKVRSRLWKMRTKFCDIDVICRDNEKIPAHKIILAASSQFLNDYLTLSDDKELKLPGFDRKYVESLLEFVYTGRVVVPASDGPKLIVLAQKWKIEGFHEGNNTEAKSVDTESGTKQ